MIPKRWPVRWPHRCTCRRKAVFPVANFGSSMAPFYTLLPLWVGALLMVVTLKTTVSRRTRKALGDPELPHWLFLGHYGVRADCAAAIHGVARWRSAVPARAGRASAAVYVVWMAGLAGVLVLHLYDGGEFLMWVRQSACLCSSCRFRVRTLPTRRRCCPTSSPKSVRSCRSPMR